MASADGVGHIVAAGEVDRCPSSSNSVRVLSRTA